MANNKGIYKLSGLTGIFCLLAGHICAQDAVKAAQLVRTVAAYIIENTSYAFVHPQTKQVYSNTAGLPAGLPLQAKSIYNKWEYSNGVMALGMLELSATLHDTTYEAYAGRNYHFVFDNEAYFRQQYKPAARPEFHNFFRMDRLDDCGAHAAALTRYNKLHPDERFTRYLNQAATFVQTGQSRLPDATLCREGPRKMTIWADDLYMSVPFLAAMGNSHAQKKYTDDAVQQVEKFNAYLYDASTGLYYHTWYGDVQSTGVAHWLRCNGWIAMAQVQLIDNLPANNPNRKKLISLLQRQITGFARYQDTSGLWHQLIDKPDSYLETSGTAMFVYAVAKAVNEGWIPAAYLSIAKDGWNGLSKQVTTDGQIQNVCIGTGVASNIKFYYERPVKLNDIHVAGAFLLAGSEMIKAFRNTEKKAVK